VVVWKHLRASDAIAVPNERIRTLRFTFRDWAGRAVPINQPVSIELTFLDTDVCQSVNGLGRRPPGRDELGGMRSMPWEQQQYVSVFLGSVPVASTSSTYPLRWSAPHSIAC
jgi:hypothetical protein